MYVNTNILNEIEYVKPSDQHRIYPSGVDTDKEIIQDLITRANPQDPDESDRDYQDRLDDEMNSYPLVGIIHRDSLLFKALDLWTQAGHQLNLYPLGNRNYYFLTCDSNYNSADVDLFQDNGSGQKIIAFIQFINQDLLTNSAII